MGIFSHGVNSGTGYSSITENATIESLVEDSSVDVDGISEDFEYEGNEAIATVTENYNNIMMAIGITEASYLERTGREFIYTEGVLGDFIGKIKSFLKKIWEKIKGLFKRFTLMIDKYNMEDKAFVKKYRKELFNGKNLSDFKFKGYKFTINDGDITKALAKCTGSTERSKTRAGQGRSQFDADNYDDKHSDELEKFRGDVLSQFTGGKAGSYTQEEFTKELRELLRNGDSEKEELDQINVGTITGELMTSRDTKKTLDNMFKTSKKAIDQDEKEIERNQKAFLNTQPLSDTAKQEKHRDWDKYDKSVSDAKTTYYADDESYKKAATAARVSGVTDKASYEALSDENRAKVKAELDKGFSHKDDDFDKDDANKISGETHSQRAAKEFNYYLRDVRETKTVMISIQTSVMAALKERSRQNKAICVKIIHYNPKSESYNESYSDRDYSSYSGSNFLAGVELK